MVSPRFTTTAVAGDAVVTQVVSEVDTGAGAEAVLEANSAVVDAVAVESSGVGAAVSVVLLVVENLHRVDEPFLQNDLHILGETSCVSSFDALFGASEQMR
jgi:hypothetical protein